MDLQSITRDCLQIPLLDARQVMGQGIRASLECGSFAAGHAKGS
jgi:hypothetical protein